MNLQPVPGEPVLHDIGGGRLALGDLHLGMVGRLMAQGIFAHDPTDEMITSLGLQVAERDISEIVLVGDITDRIARVTERELRDLRRMIDSLPTVRWHLVPGNHDGGLVEEIRSAGLAVRCHSVRGLALDEVGYVHGHARPSDEVLNCETIVMSHLHPGIALEDEVGTITKKRCWMRAQIEDRTWIIMPGFNPLCSVASVNRMKEIDLPGLGTEIPRKSWEVFLLDGTQLGSMDQLDRATSSEQRN